MQVVLGPVNLSISVGREIVGLLVEGVDDELRESMEVAMGTTGGSLVVEELGVQKE
jgi:hypothetical protein